ncbi:pyridoxamine 5'-phosphate oxidase family protein [Halomarina salina]|uniref:Pyridoxamine 5'-phosphate oxidase family protein n=1 Tax=Halomarina salina TaxID=1872699 RepID=A0ABD5RMT2_9EURY|nr:pyridoxamine 5'-phosphate oxidase family protein [Halomarina salina]
MTLAQETEMTESEIDAFLGRHETGVLSLADDGTPYAIPISYGYDAAERAFYMRLVSTPESEKRQFLGSSPRSRLVVYEEADGGDTYRSVVAVGALEDVAVEELTVEHIEQYGEAKRPLFEIWGRSKRDLDIQLYTLEPEELSGRRTEIDRDADE